jgi:hypothetical protein
MRGRKIKKICKNCNNEFEVLMIKVRQNKGIFCSTNCYHEFLRKNSNGYIFDTKLANVFYQKKSKYGLTKEEYLKLFANQNNKCAICEISFDKVRACVDHSHKNGVVRGLLCDKCNKGLGSFNDNIPLLKKAIEYLK